MRNFLLLSILFFYQSFLVAQIKFSSQKVIDNSTFFPKTVDVADLNGDGMIDILIGNHTDLLSGDRSDNKISLYISNGNGSFNGPHKISAGNGKIWFVTAGDLDGDNDMDIIGSWEQGPEYLISWYENTDGKGNFSTGIAVQKDGFWAGEVYAKDIDNDSDLDVVYANPFKDSKHIAWNENLDGNGTFSEKKIIASNSSDVLQISIADIDKDNDLDVIAAFYEEKKVSWYKNIDGKGAFSDENLVFRTGTGALCVSAADIDGDCDTDILYGDGVNEIAWFENSDGQGSFYKEHLITKLGGIVKEIHTADLDMDGDIDVISASLNMIAVFENIDGKGTFGAKQTISNSVNNAKAVHCADFDGDGDLDIVSVSSHDNKVAWYENLTSTTAIIDNRTKLPNKFQLYQNYPNPFNPSTTIKYNLHKSSDVIMKIYNLFGQEIETLVNVFQTAGEHAITWQPKGLPSGIYFYRLQAGGFTDMRKMIFME